MSAWCLLGKKLAKLNKNAPIMPIFFILETLRVAYSASIYPNNITENWPYDYLIIPSLYFFNNNLEKLFWS